VYVQFERPKTHSHYSDGLIVRLLSLARDGIVGIVTMAEDVSAEFVDGLLNVSFAVADGVDDVAAALDPAAAVVQVAAKAMAGEAALPEKDL
jgi:hypothetical protein